VGSCAIIIEKQRDRTSKVQSGILNSDSAVFRNFLDPRSQRPFQFFDHTGFRSKSWNEFSGVGATPLHFVFTVCDNAAAEACPFWPSQPMTAHWACPIRLRPPAMRPKFALRASGMTTIFLPIF
jgi:hypothetical protein